MLDVYSGGSRCWARHYIKLQTSRHFEILAQNLMYKRKRGPPTTWVPRKKFLAALAQRRAPPRKPKRASAGGAAPPELKFHDLDIDDAIVGSGGFIEPSLVLIAQGLTESTRIGRKITVKNIGWKFTISLPEIDAAASPSTGDVVRVIMYVDKQCNGATIAVLDKLELADFQSFNNLSNSGRFLTLMDQAFDMNYAGLASDNAGVVSQGDVLHHYEWYKKVNIPIEYAAGTNAITEIKSNNIGVLLIGRNSVSGFTSSVRIRYTDG